MEEKTETILTAAGVATAIVGGVALLAWGIIGRGFNRIAGSLQAEDIWMRTQVKEFSDAKLLGSYSVFMAEVEKRGKASPVANDPATVAAVAAISDGDLLHMAAVLDDEVKNRGLEQTIAVPGTVIDNIKAAILAKQGTQTV